MPRESTVHGFSSSVTARAASAVKMKIPIASERKNRRSIDFWARREYQARRFITGLANRNENDGRIGRDGATPATPTASRVGRRLPGLSRCRDGTRRVARGPVAREGSSMTSPRARRQSPPPVLGGSCRSSRSASGPSSSRARRSRRWPSPRSWATRRSPGCPSSRACTRSSCRSSSSRSSDPRVTSSSAPTRPRPRSSRRGSSALAPRPGRPQYVALAVARRAHAPRGAAPRRASSASGSSPTSCRGASSSAS